MRNMLTAVLVVAAAPALASDRFAPGNPWFAEFEATCRDGAVMHEECQAGVMGAYAEYAGSTAIRCDFAAFWRTADELGEIVAALPWQYGVETIVQTPGVCETR